VKEHLTKLYKAFDNRTRLGIMSALMVNESVDFSTLKELLGVTDGNLASHLKALEGTGFVQVKKSFIDRKPNTQYHATREGRKAFNQHLDALANLIRQQHDNV